jgi:hypothetical protein
LESARSFLRSFKPRRWDCVPDDAGNFVGVSMAALDIPGMFVSLAQGLSMPSLKPAQWRRGLSAGASE